MYHHFRFRGPRIPVDFVFVPRHNFPPEIVCVAFSFLRFLPEWDPSAFRRHRSFDPRVFRSRNTPAFLIPMVDPNGRISVGCRLRGRGEGKGRKQEKRTRPDKSKGGKRRKRNFLFCRAREATFPVQATAKKVYLGLFPTACFPAIRIFTLPLPTRRHHVFYWHEFQSYFFIYCFSLFLRVLRFLNKDPSVLLWILCRRWWKLFVYVSKWNILIEEEDCSSKFYQWSNILRYNFLRLIYRRFIIYFWNYKFVKILTIRQTILFYFQVLSL